MVKDEFPHGFDKILSVGEVISRQILCCHLSTPICDAVKMMCELEHSSIVVVFEGVVEGIWTETDALKLASFDRLSEDPISTVMRHPVKQINEHVPMEDAALEMQMSGLRHLLVVDQELWPVGLLTQTDVVRSQGVEHDLVLRDVSSVISNALILLPEDLPAIEAAKQLSMARIDAAAVEYRDSDELGIFTERDYLKVLAEGKEEIQVGAVASRPLAVVSEHSSLLNARSVFEERGFRHLGVIGGEPPKLKGILSFTEIMLGIEHDYVHHLRDALKARNVALCSSQENLYLAQQVIEASRDGIMVTDANGIIQSVNPAFTQITGFTAEEAVGKTPGILKSGRHDAEFYRQMWEAVTLDDHWSGEVWNCRKSGEIYPEWLSINAIRNDAGEIVKLAAILSDITDRKKNEERIKSLAYFDVLTGLPNRRLFNDRLSMALANARRHDHELSIIFLDLDLFKRINDTLGHSAGDEVLQEVAVRLRKCLREGDTAARMGGDEFTLLLQEIESPEVANSIAQRVNEVISQPFEVAGNTLHITASIGISLYPHDGTDAETLMRNADTAMYSVKEVGRNGFQLYDAEMNVESKAQLLIENNLRVALLSEELSLVYQPKVALSGGRISGLEALVRWDNPELGRISPAVFIPLAEKIGCIEEIGQWVLAEAASQCRKWIEQGYTDLCVAVNVSVLQLRQKDFPDMVFRIIEEQGLAPHHIELELTESVFMEHLDDTVAMLLTLKERGVHISIDDFGTGFSSFSYLKRLPIDKLKIDISFIRDIPQSPDGCEIVNAIIAMAHKLGLVVVAEGVETEEQLMFLKANHCDEIQGYHISKPASAAELEPLLAVRRMTVD